MAVTAQPDSGAAASEASAGNGSAGKAAARTTATGKSTAGKLTAGHVADQAGPPSQAELASRDAGAGHSGRHGKADGADDDATQRDPWFEPEPPVSPEPQVAQLDAPDTTAPGQSGDSVGSEGAAGNRQAEWFLPAGRAGLLPDSITESWDEDPDQGSSRPATASAPPWASEAPTPAVSKPPPWESGPWPGPGGVDSAGRAGANGGRIQASTTAGAGRLGRQDLAVPAGSDLAYGAPALGNPAHGARVTAGMADGDAAQARWQAPAAVVAGIMPLVVPGLVLGILGLRRAGPSGSGRLAYWTAIGMSAVWAIVIVLLVTGGSPAGGCAGYPASVRAAYTKAMGDINGKAPAAVQAADLAAAADKANSAAADTAQIPVRSALFRMASDLQQVKADVVASRPVSADVLAHLKSDGTTFPQSCPG